MIFKPKIKLPLILTVVISALVILAIIVTIIIYRSNRSSNTLTPSPTSSPSVTATPSPTGDTSNTITTTTPTTNTQNQSFHYQLQNAKVSNLLTLETDLLVVDPDDLNAKKAEIEQLKSSGKTVLAYLSIGEAESYRDYWKKSWKVGSPKFIDKENPDWDENYKVKYWYKDWQSIILARAQEIINQGYSGLYLDIIDAYWYYEEKGRDSAAQEMADFVAKISQTAKKANPTAIIIGQNAAELYKFELYKNSLDGLAREDLWYNDNQTQDKEDTNYTLPFLEKAYSDGKIIMIIDYPTKNAKICDFYKTCQGYGFRCTVGDRELERNKMQLCLNQ